MILTAVPMRRRAGVGIAAASLFFSVVATTAAGAAPAALTYADLARRLVDLERLARAPAPGERCAQWSSWDRGSRYDAEHDRYVNWGANGDGSGIIRREGDLEVLAEMDGPGCIWRIWSALPQKGRVRIYLDGASTPAVDLPFADYFRGSVAPFNYPMLSYRLEDLGSRGQNLYFPIPYQRSCRIVAEKGWGRYYHFTYTTYPKGTSVPTFSADLVAENAAALREVNDYLAHRQGTDPAGPRAGEQTVTREIDVAPGATATVAELQGPRAITALRAKIAFKDRKDGMAALRQLALSITWDGEARPAVWCPLGDFFGTAPGENLYRSLPAGMTEKGYYALWYMPFARRAVVTLANDGAVTRRVRFEIVHAPLSRPFEGLCHFHCKWHRDVFPLPEERFPDWVMLRTSGRGRFCGVMLHIWNPRGGWWGEGDEKFFVDGEKFPSTIGTGSEDYFGYAWGNPSLFQRPYHCQTMTENNRGHQSVLRWHVVDNVPFQKSIETCIEKYYKNDRGTLYACVACWYLAPGGEDPFTPAPVTERCGYYRDPDQTAGGFKILERTGGVVQTQELGGLPGGRWDRGDQLWWTEAKPGNTLVIALPVTTDGRYTLTAVFTKARDYGIVELSLDGKRLGGPVDLYNPEVVPTPPISLGEHRLTRGVHRFTVRIAGANPNAVKAYMFGLDTLKLTRRD